MLTRYCLVLLLLVGAVTPLWAQNQPIHMRPEFPLVFPLTTGGKDNHEVTVKFPVMINPATVINPGMQLRVLYVLSTGREGTSDLVLAHHGTIEQSYSRNTSSGDANDPKLPPEVAHEIEGYRRTVWDVPNNFILAMAQYPTDAMHLIFSPTAHSNDLVDERFSFFDGLFIGLPDGNVTVIAVEKESKTASAGLKAGDVILAVGDYPTKNDLGTFAAAYSKAKKVATDSELPSYSMTIQSSGKGTEKINIPLPPKLEGGLMNGFFDQDKPQKKDTDVQKELGPNVPGKG